MNEHVANLLDIIEKIKTTISDNDYKKFLENLKHLQENNSLSAYNIYILMIDKVFI